MEPTGPRCSECRRAGIFATQGDGHSRLNEVEKGNGASAAELDFRRNSQGPQVRDAGGLARVEMTGVVDPLPCVAEIRQWLAMSKYGGM